MTAAMRDARGVPTSATEQASLAGYETALRQLHGYRGDPVATIDGVLAADRDFVMGHVLRAAVMVTMWERSMQGEIESTLLTLRDLGNRANDRERAWTAALAAWFAGDWEGMRQRLDHLLVDHPRDALALQVGHLADFYLGDRENLRGRIARALPAWSRETPGYGFVLGMRAFGHEECGDYGAAEAHGRHALEIEADDGWAHHAVTHVMEMQARQAEGAAWMESRVSHWAQPDNAFAFHNWWHAALFHLDLDHVERVLAIYDTRIRPGESQVQLEMVDAASLLWRMHLRGIDVGDRWRSIADAYERADEPGFYAFNDMHAMMAYVGSGRSTVAARMLAAVERVAADETTNGGMTRSVGLAIVRAIAAFGRGRWDETISLLLPVRYRANTFGGSHAQRDIVHRTLLEAALRQGDRPLATALAAERTALKPHCPFAWRERRRAEALPAAA